MKKILVLIALVLLSNPCNASEEEGASIEGNYSMTGEALEEGKALSVGMHGEAFRFLSVGGSINYVTTNKVIQFGKRQTILPLYLFIRVKTPWRFSPYLEVGMDLIEGILDDINNNEDNTDTAKDVDYYFSAGLNFKLDQRFSLQLYAKQYVFLFHENFDSPLERENLTGYGLGVSMRY
ncbi:MAG: outer membrane beta-barrel protein [Gammaproteobacteria bacterium]|nr:outer membrane beta-barrel protein [Gammaproteobacteria bacterium]